VCAIAVAVDLGWPIVFAQRRPGLHGREFTLYKFRTMKPSTVVGEAAAETDAQRLTPFGRMLRTTSLDELPELWNVIRGDMSLVGPRPLLVEYLPRYTLEQSRRHLVRPGITGWAQVQGRNAISWDRRLSLDVWYVDHQSFILDCRILAMTVWNVIRRRGIAAPGFATMPAFRGNGESCREGQVPGSLQEPARNTLGE
jgi:lipopolysaccharide/colanic/teichoic acid biosynthesis glycosyltransferase